MFQLKKQMLQKNMKTNHSTDVNLFPFYYSNIKWPKTQLERSNMATLKQTQHYEKKSFGKQGRLGT